MVAIAIKMLKSTQNIKLIVSYSDQDQNHLGGIYKAGNWIYTGLLNQGTRGAFIINGKKVHNKTIHSMGLKQSLKTVKSKLDPNATEFITSGKHKYLMPLDSEMRKQIEPLRKPYPKRASVVQAEQQTFQSDNGSIKSDLDAPK